MFDQTTLNNDCIAFQSKTPSLPRSTPDLSQKSMELTLDTVSNGSWSSSSGSGHRRSSPAETFSRRFGDSSSTGDCSSLVTPIRRPSTISPHHNRSLSFRNMKRPTLQQVQAEDLSFRSRVVTMPSDSASYLLARRRLRSRLQDRNLTPSPPILDHEPTDEDEDYYLLRSFSITSKGGVVNRGDYLRQRSRSNNSVASTGSSITTGGNGTSCASNATSYSSGQGRGPSRRVIMLGDIGVGKTALVSQFMTSEYMNTYETQDEDMEKSVSVLLDGDEYELVFLDEPLPSESKVDDEADAFVVVYSLTDRGSFEKAVDILFGLREKGITMNKAVILVGNKSDLARSREISIEEGKSVAISYECKFTETSAGINHNVDELLVGVVSQIRLKARQMEDLQNFSSPQRKRRSKGSLRSSLRARGILNRFLGKGEGRSKSCDNLHVL